MLRDYESRKMITIKPIHELVIRKNELNDYRSLFLKGNPNGGIRMKNLPDFRVIEVNNLSALEFFESGLDKAIDQSIEKNSESHELTKTLIELRNQVRTAMQWFIKE